MSRVTNVLVSVGSENDETLLDALDFDGQRLKNICAGKGDENQWGGRKYPEWDLYGAALNHVDMYDVMKQIAAIKWEHPEDLRLMIQDDDCKTAGVWVLVEGYWQPIIGMQHW